MGIYPPKDTTRAVDAYCIKCRSKMLLRARKLLLVEFCPRCEFEKRKDRKKRAVKRPKNSRIRRA